MAVGSGLSASVGIATEPNVGVPVAVTRFVEFDTESLQLKKGIVQGAGLRGGGLVKRAQRRIVVSRQAGGDVSFAPTTNGFGLFLQHMFGSYSTTPVSIGGGLYRQVHNTGPLAGKTFTTQVIKPDTTSVLAPQAFTYPGCKVTDWEISTTQNAEVKLKLTIDALDEATPSNGFVSTTLAAAVTAGAVSISTVASIPAGSWVTLDIGLVGEVVQTGVPSGAGPYTIPLVNAGGASQAHAVGAYLGSSTNVNYGAATALQAASYIASTTLFTFNEGKIVAGGSTTSVSGLWTNTGGQPVANVRMVSIKGKSTLKQDRFGLGNTVRNEQLDNGFRDYTASADVEYNGRAFYDAFAADLPLCLVLTFTTPTGSSLQLYCPAAFQNDGSTPQVAGPDIIIEKLAFSILDDGVNGAIQAVYISTDVSV